MKPIYVPAGRAKEYGDYAINIYTGCPHRCYYCFAPTVLHKDREQFHSVIEPRKGIVEAVKRQLETEHITGKLIHLCFTCDPYPMGYDSTPTREIVKAIKDSGNHVQILTKNPVDAKRDFDLLDSGDWFGVTITCNTDKAKINEPCAENPFVRLIVLADANVAEIQTWLSCEPVLDEESAYKLIAKYHDCFDKIKIGKLNYWPSEINWKEFGIEAERLCKEHGVDCYIKEDLRKAMESGERQ